MISKIFFKVLKSGVGIDTAFLLSKYLIRELIYQIHAGCLQTMSINAITSVSLYEYYYTINNNNKNEDIKAQEKTPSPLAREMKEYGLTPTDDEAKNAMLLKQAQLAEKLNNTRTPEEVSPQDRPWADLMYQLNISFNEDPKDDIEDIKKELKQLTIGISDDELEQEVDDLENYVDGLYLDFQRNSSKALDLSGVLNNQLQNLYTQNMVSLLR